MWGSSAAVNISWFLAGGKNNWKLRCSSFSWKYLFLMHVFNVYPFNILRPCLHNIYTSWESTERMWHKIMQETASQNIIIIIILSLSIFKATCKSCTLIELTTWWVVPPNVYNSLIKKKIHTHFIIRLNLQSNRLI